jgi:membrane-bound ClpP family serine protease
MTTELNPNQERYEARYNRRAGRISLTGPIILIALGAMFLVGEFVPEWGVNRTWPILLIVIGLAKLLDSAWPGRSAPPR